MHRPPDGAQCPPPHPNLPGADLGVDTRRGVGRALSHRWGGAGRRGTARDGAGERGRGERREARLALTVAHRLQPAPAVTHTRQGEGARLALLTLVRRAEPPPSIVTPSRHSKRPPLLVSMPSPPHAAYLRRSHENNNNNNKVAHFVTEYNASSLNSSPTTLFKAGARGRANEQRENKKKKTKAQQQ
jgi:hypothetical protein